MIFCSGLKPLYSYPLGPDRCQMVADFVERGGGFLMVGSYLSFVRFNGIARYHDTVIETVLPVTVSPYDDRVEVVAGFRFEIVDPAHPTVAGLDWDRASFTLCGYNRVTLKPDAHLVARYRGDPMIATGAFGRGRTANFASDFAPTGPVTFRAGRGTRGLGRRCPGGQVTTAVDPMTVRYTECGTTGESMTFGVSYGLSAQTRAHSRKRSGHLARRSQKAAGTEEG